VLILLSVALLIAPLTRRYGKLVGFWAAAFTVAVLLGHLVGNRGSSGPVVPKGRGAAR
jgi:hypothetical protein